MAYTDLTTSFQYRSLLTHQLQDALAENDKVFNDLLTAVTDFDNNLRFNNAKYLQGEIAAGSTYKKLIGLDASNIVQLSESGTEVRVPADPSNALGVATKQYVDGVQMFQTQPLVSGVGTNAYVTILSLSATTRGHIRALYVKKGGGSVDNILVRITIDGGTPVVYTFSTVTPSKYRALQPNLTTSTTDQASADLVSFLLDIAFNSSLLVECADNHGAGDTSTCYVVYDKIP